MREIISLILTIAFGFNFLFAEDHGVTDFRSMFSIDEQSINDEFKDLTELENHIRSKPGITFSELQQTETSYVSNLNLTKSEYPLAPQFTIDDMDWNAFAWGFCCCPIGFFVVAVNNDKDKDQKLSYWIGTGIGCAASVITNFFWYMSNPAYY